MFRLFELDPGHCLLLGRLPQALCAKTQAEFALWWQMHPETFPTLHIHGRLVQAPRWQQAYGQDYRYSGQTSRALPPPPMLAELLGWARGAIDARLNGALLNWYDGALGHRIGAHRDSTTGLLPGSPIVTLSLGEERVFRLRRWKQKGFQDLPLSHGSVVVMPWATNLAYTHEIPQAVRFHGQRVSVTLRAFEGQEEQG